MIAEGEVVGGPLELVVSLGEQVVIQVISDVDNEVHVHGYDLGFDIGPDQASEIRFVADVPGIFEIELHDANHTVIAEVTVS
jgi:heme/copper-type cytochrome/quinol oxidase subunit 2